MNDTELARLELYAQKHGMTHSGAMRFCFLKEADEESIPEEPPKIPPRKRKR